MYVLRALLLLELKVASDVWDFGMSRMELRYGGWVKISCDAGSVG